MIGMEQFGLKMWIKCKTVIQVDHSASSFLVMLVEFGAVLGDSLDYFPVSIFGYRFV